MISEINPREEKMKIACLGLSANPPHLGHLWLAREVLRLTDRKEVWFVPCYKHSFGKDLIPWRHRLAMCKLMEKPGLKISGIEAKRRRVSYTIDTVRALTKQFPLYDFIWVIGADIVQRGEYLKWKNWNILQGLVKFIVMPRHNFTIPENLSACFTAVNVPNPPVSDISSTMIRDRLGNGMSIAGLVTPEVEEYILRNGLYREQSPY